MNIIKRNMPILIIGGVTLLIFLVIIILGKKNSNPTGMQKVEETELISEHTYTTGNPNAKVVLVEFSDFQCPACGAAEPYLEDIIARYKDSLKFAYRDFPLPQHQYAQKASEAAQAAGKQGKFWEYHDMLFRNQENLAHDDLIKYAKALDLDVDKFTKDLDNGAFATFVNDDVKTGIKLNINSTPTFFLNGRKLNLTSFVQLDGLISSEIEKNKTSGSETGAGNTAVNEIPDAQRAAEATTTPLYIDQKYGILEISYTDGGFDPKNTAGYIGQLVRWTNKIGKTITIIDKSGTFPEFKSGVSIEPGKTYDYRLFGQRLWTYEEKDSQNFGSIYVNIPE